MPLSTKGRAAVDALDQLLAELATPTGKASRFRTMKQLAEERGLSVDRVRAALVRAQAEGRLERGPCVFEHLNGRSQTTTGFAVKAK